MKKHELLVFSVYSHTLENYPYFPFVAKSVPDAIKKFIRFCSDRASICEGAELHWIGTCECYWDKDPDSPQLENIQPLAFPQRITFKKDLFGRLISRVFVLGVLYHDKIVGYLQDLFKKGGFNGKN